MAMIGKRKMNFYRKLAFVMAIIMLGETILPSVSLALTSGPASPEFSSFEPVATNSMVNEFTGDFTYNLPVLNIPGANGGGYALSLSYHGGENVESEASWVGYGWTLNPGAINRSKRGFADDSKGENITYYNDVPRNWTASLGRSWGSPEAFGFDFPISVNSTLRYNNYKGFGYTVGAGISYKGILSLGYSYSDGTGSFSVKVNPAGLLSAKDSDEKKKERSEKYKAADDQGKKKMLQEASKGSLEGKVASRIGSAVSSFGMQSISDVVRPTRVTQYRGTSVNFSLSSQPNPFVLPMGVEFGYFGSYSEQVNVPNTSQRTYGYLYSHDATGTDMMDYFVEKESHYNKRDRYLSIPFSNADMYAVTGEGLGGGFRMWNRNIGHFHPNAVQSTTTIAQLGFETMYGANMGTGGDLGVGFQTLSVDDKWENDGSGNGNTETYKFTGNADEAYFFRFTNDLGGNVSYGESDDEALTASITNLANVPGFKKFKADIPSTKLNTNLTSTIDDVNRSGRSSYIAYHTNSEMLQTSSSGVKYRAYDKNASTEKHISRTSVPNGIGEIVSFNEAGNRYIYGLPVYARNEKSLQYDLKGATVNNNYVAYKDIIKTDNTEDYKMKVGEEKRDPYATSYLLTEITTPDYIDRTLNGATDDDFGGYTKFSYDRLYGSNNKKDYSASWYNWRIPYTGMQYNPARLSDNSDDVGNFTSGEKEIYHLRTIETKTHLAVFVTNKSTFEISGVTFNGNGVIQGSDTDRLDAIEAALNKDADNVAVAKGSKKLKKLERIELYAKPTDGSTDYKLIKTVRLDYDYSLCQGTPNTENGGGKLSLKKVWFESNGVVSARISPFTFEYNYPVAAEYPSKYQSFLDGLSGLNENPNYSPFAIDAWGNYQAEGEIRHNKMKKWLDQNQDDVTFDPAAWQLKVIKLPSGGEIHVQYEQDDYLYVQDRSAMAMVSLIPASEVKAKLEQDFDGTWQSLLEPGQVATQDLLNKYYLNIDKDLGVTLLADKQKLADLITKEFKDKKIHFKFLYALLGTTPDLGSCNSDYIDGYVNLASAGVDNGKLYIRLGSGQPLGTGSTNPYELPRQVCKDYIKSEIGGKLKPLNNCDASEAGVDNGNEVADVLQELIAKIGTSVIPNATCLALKEELSYFRIPVLNPKKGGGLRVKRILKFDNGIEEGNSVLYGNEYIYKTVDGKSSGVASNEPSSIREENALITFEPKRSEQNFWQKITSGRDKEQFEGPIGESMLPSPIVGYSRVVIKNIHNGKTNSGFTVSEFFTTWDYPFDKAYKTHAIQGKGVEHTPLQEESDWMILPTGIVNLSVTNKWASQGFRFIINNMSGQPKSIATYGGEYTSGNLSNSMLSSLQEFAYYEPGEKIPVMTEFSPNSADYEMMFPGKETEVVMERKSVEDITHDGNIEFDFSISLTLPIVTPFLTGMPSYTYAESKLRTHVTTKVVSYPVIQKSVTTFQDGIYHLTENVAFNPHNGKPIVTRTTDGYNQLDLQQSANHDGSYTNYQFPASQQYREMAQKAINERKAITNSNISMALTGNATSGYYLAFEPTGTSGPDAVCNAINNFVRGDLIKVDLEVGTYFFNTDEKSGNSIKVLPALKYNSGNVSNTGYASRVEIIRSGRTNQLNQTAGSITVYGNNPNYTQVGIPNSALASRIDFANALTAALNNPGATTVNYTGTVKIIDPVTGDCINVDASKITLDHRGSNVTVKYQTKQGYQVPVTLDSHPLVGDLNNWLNKAWALELQQLSSFPTDLFSSCADQLRYTYRGINSNTFLNQYKQYIGINSLLANQYNILGNNQQGLSFITFSAGGNTCMDNVDRVAKMDISSLDINNVNLRVDVRNQFNPTVECLGSGGVTQSHFSLGTCTRSFNDSQDPNQNNAALYNFIKNNKQATGNLGEFHNDENGWLYFITHGFCGNNRTDIMQLIRPETVPDEFCTQTFLPGGTFSIDQQTGDLVYAESAGCITTPVNCFKFCSEAMLPVPYKTINAIASSAVTFDDSWAYNQSIYGATTGNDYEIGAKGKWRPKSTFAYQESIIGGSKPNERNYKNAGTYQLRMFSWDDVENNSGNWLKANTVMQYSPNGESIEEKDILGIYKTAKFGYKGMIPYVVSQNADYNSVQFESFENLYTGNKLEDGVSVTNALMLDFAKAHSGRGSLKLVPKNQTNHFQFLRPFVLSDQIKTAGLSIKVWVKDPGYSDQPIIGAFNSPTPAKAFAFKFNKIAQTGEWTLYEANITDFTNFVAGSSYTPIIMSGYATGTQNVWIDDVRIQPKDAQAMAYVYDVKTLRPIAVFDDQHFGKYNQYNAEGKLVRTLIETEKGMKTVQETQYNIPSVQR